MPTSDPPIEATLQTWADVDPALTNRGLLLGNGASRVIWDSFAYDSLYERAKSLPNTQALTADDIAIFTDYLWFPVN